MNLSQIIDVQLLFMLIAVFIYCKVPLLRPLNVKTGSEFLN